MPEWNVLSFLLIKMSVYLVRNAVSKGSGSTLIITAVENSKYVIINDQLISNAKMTKR